MAGYIFTFSTPESLTECVRMGAYSTVLSEPIGYWRTNHEGTFADYASMKAGDNVYFFSKRLIYGIGTLTNVGEDCKYLNYPNANVPQVPDYEAIREGLLVDFGNESAKNRFICFFIPDPHIFQRGVDMDDVLGSDPQSFRMLRVFSQLSFIKFGDEENQAFKNILLKRNSEALQNVTNLNTFVSDHQNTHAVSLGKLTADHILDVVPLLDATVNNDGSVNHEMAIEAAVIAEISNETQQSLEIFGHWDYITHQVAASPLKPVQYIDKMDLFGYAFIPQHPPTIEKYLVGEVKAGQVTKSDLLQLMKYVDWVRDEYASGDYSAIRGFLIGFGFGNDLLQEFSSLVERQFVSGSRDRVENQSWSNVVLVKYFYDSEQKRVNLQRVDPQPQ